MSEETLERKKELLEALLGDVEMFGPAGDDMVRINRLRAEIKELEHHD